MEERSYPGPDYQASYHTGHMGDRAEARAAEGDNLSGDDNDTGDNLRGFALMISKLLFSLAQL